MGLQVLIYIINHPVVESGKNYKPDTGYSYLLDV